MTKEELRIAFKQKRLSLSEEKVNDFSAILAERVLQELKDAPQYIHLFLPIKKFNEPNTFILLEQLLLTGHYVYTSITDRKTMRLNHVKLEKETVFECDQWGIPVPVNAEKTNDKLYDVIFVPLLCCDLAGHRVGYGKGFYDGFMKDHPASLKIGLGYFEPVNVILDTHEADVRLNKLITPQQTYMFDHEKN